MRHVFSERSAHLPPAPIQRSGGLDESRGSWTPLEQLLGGNVYSSPSSPSSPLAQYAQ